MPLSLEELINATQAARGPTGVPSRWRKPPTEGGTGAYFESMPKTWPEFGQNFVQSNVPQEEDTQEERIRKVMGMIGPSAVGMLGGRAGALRSGVSSADFDALEKMIEDIKAVRGPNYPARSAVFAEDLWKKMPGASVGAEGRARWEIPPHMELTPTGRSIFENQIPEFRGTVGQLVDAPYLFRAYPDIRNSMLELGWEKTPGGRASSWGQSPTYPYGEISGKMNTADDALAILPHEFQHWIQQVEGFPRGGSPRNILAQPGFGKFERLTLPENIRLDRYIEAIARERGKAEITPALRTYYRLMGETEARNIQNRFPDEVRKEIPPLLTEDIPRHLQLLRPQEAPWIDPRTMR